MRRQCQQLCCCRCPDKRLQIFFRELHLMGGKPIDSVELRVARFVNPPP